VGRNQMLKTAVFFILAIGAGLMPLQAQQVQEMKSILPGTWQGVLKAGAASLRIVFHVSQTGESFSASMDSPDQGVRGIRVASVKFIAPRVTFDVPSINGMFSGSLNQAGTRIEGEWKQAGRSFALVLEKSSEGSAIQAAPKRPQEPKPPFPYREVEVSFRNSSAGITLAGTLTLPAGKCPFPAAVLVTGSGPQDRDEALAGHRPFLVVADYLARRGIAVLRYDDRGVGSSQGSFAEATTFDLTEDAEAAISFLSRHPEIDPLRIGMAGHSEGAIIAAIAASRNPQIAFIIMLAGPGIRGDQLLLLQNAAIGLASGMNPAQIKKANDMNRRLYALARQKASQEELQRTIAHELEQWIDSDPSLDPAQKAEQKAQVPAMAAQLVSPWMRLFLSLDPSEYLKNVKIPVLAMIGSKDLQVPPEENIPALQKALKEAGNTKSKTLVLQGLNHLFQHAKTGLPAEYAEIEETFAPQALSTMAEFILDVCGR